ncbi:sialic acid-binding Ig-like lectin 14 [Macrotis lagotis]|uniref:sialic acid-binding Ig-like lectin 14 n=1 Tax=Macrotis lagotis TaxID=92651 RepID=UPI003D69CACF
MLLLLLPLLWDGSLSFEWTLKVKPSVTVQEGMCARIPCSFTFPSSYNRYEIYGSWIREGPYGRPDIYNAVVTTDPSVTVDVQNQGRFHLLGDPRKRNCSLSITDAQLTDTGRYYFRFRGFDRYTFTDNLYVNVTALIQKPDISTPEKLESGNLGILNCTFPWACGGDSSPRFSWKGDALSSRQEDPEASHFSELSFIPGYQHHGTNLTCQVTFPGGRLSTQRTIQLNVSYAVQNISITFTKDNRTTVFIPENSSSLVMQKGEHLHLFCTANSNPPAILHWILGDQILVSSQSSDDGGLQLERSHLSPDDGGKYTCLAEHPLGSQNISLSLSVPYTPKIVSPSCSWDKETLFCTCSVQADPAPLVSWLIGGKPVEGNGSSNTFQVTSTKSGSWVNSSLSMNTDRIPNNTISCEGKNPKGTHTLLFHLVADKITLSHEFQRGMIMGVLCGVGISSLLALCLLFFLIKRLKKSMVSSTAGASREGVEDPKRSSWVNQSHYSISPAADTVPTPTAPEDELHYTYLNFQGLKLREDHGSTDALTEYSEIKFQ